MKKLLGITIFLSVIVAIAGTIADLEFLSDKFMDESVSMAQTSNSQRYIASNDLVDGNDVFFPVNEKNSELVNGMWTITKYTYKYDLGEKMNLDAYVELIANARVEVSFMVREEDGTEREVSLEFDMMEEYEGGVLRLTNVVGENDTESLELVRKTEKKVAKKKITKEEQNQNEEELKGKANEDNVDLVVVSAQNPVKDKKARVSSDITGNITIVDGVIEEVSVTIGNKSITFEEEVVLKTAGIFNTTYEGEHISGRYTKLNESSVKVRFFSGPLAGNIVVFGTEDVRENKIEEMEEAVEQANERVSRFDGEPYYDRNSDQVKYVASNQEEMQDKAEQTGFDFTQDYE